MVLAVIAVTRRSGRGENLTREESDSNVWQLLICVQGHRDTE